MENVVKKACATGQEVYLPELPFLSKQLCILSAFYTKMKTGIVSIKDFIDCPSFYEGENTDTSRFDSKIQMINMVNNK